MKFSLEKIDKHETGKILGRHPDGLKLLRRNEVLLKDIHYWEENSRTTRYNKALIEHGAIFGFDSPEHQQAIAEFLAWIGSLPGGKHPGRRQKNKLPKPEALA